MNKETKLLKYLSNEGKTYQLNVGDLNVEISYSKNNKTLDECMLDILKQKIKAGGRNNWLEENQNMM